MVWHIKKASRHHARFVFLAEQLTERISMSADQLRKRDRAGFRPDGQQIFARAKKLFEQRAVAIQQLFCARGNLRQMFQGQNAEQFRWMRGHNTKQVVEAPHTFGQRLCRENPSAAQSR